MPKFSVIWYRSLITEGAENDRVSYHKSLEDAENALSKIPSDQYGLIYDMERMRILKDNSN